MFDDEVTIWTSPVRRIGDKRPSYLYCEIRDTIVFRTIKDKYEIGYLDKKTNTLYLNDDYKMQFKAIKKQIIKDYEPKFTTRYLNLHIFDN